MKNKKPNRKLKIVLYVLGIWWAIAFLFAAFQAYSMSRLGYSIPIGLLLSIAVLFLHVRLYHKLAKNRKGALIAFYVYASIHFIPLFLQLVGLKTPGADNIIAAFIRS